MTADRNVLVTVNRKDLEQLVEVHEHEGAGKRRESEIDSNQKQQT